MTDMIGIVRKSAMALLSAALFSSLVSCASSPSGGASPAAQSADRSATAALSKDGLSFPPRPTDTKLYNTAIMNSESEWTVNNVHDPAIFKDGDTYWLYSTDVAVGYEAQGGIQIRKSRDLINWTWVGRAFKGVPAAAKAYTGVNVLWAPDIIKLGETYYLYYSASVIYTQTSCIGVATAPNPAGPWTDQGIVVKSDSSLPVNAIDPAISLDASGRLWMVYGSFANGIYIVELDRTTGKLLGKVPGTRVACRSEGGGPGEEGPYIIYNPEFRKYYLFVSYDNFLVDYQMRVGRADSITGPYYDYKGHKMTDYPNSEDVPLDVEIIGQDVGYKLMGSYRFKVGEGWLAPGHNSVLNDGGRWFLVHHARPSGDKNWPYLHVRSLLWSDDGWPLASPERWAGETEEAIPQTAVAGKWEFITHQRLAWEDPVSSPVSLTAAGGLAGELGGGSWKLVGESAIEITIDDYHQSKAVIRAKLIAGWDWELGRGALLFTGIDQDGEVWWGKRIRNLQ